MKLKKIVLTAIMTAVYVVLNELVTIDIPPTSSPLMRISLGIIPMFVTAYYCGIVYSMIEGVIGDILGFVLVGAGKGYTFFPGYTLNAFLSGLIIGFFILIRKFMNTKKGLILLIITDIIFTVSSCLIFSIMVNTGAFKDLNFEVIKNHPNIYLYIIGFSILINVGIIVYAIITRGNKDSNAIVMSYIVYLYVVSLFLTPLWNNLLYHGGNFYYYFYYWITRLITVPAEIIIYTLVSKLIIYPINKIYESKFKKDETE